MMTVLINVLYIVYNSSCLGPENSSCEMYPFLSLSSCWKISSTSLSFSFIMFLNSSASCPSAAFICFFRYPLTCDIPNVVRFRQKSLSHSLPLINQTLYLIPAQHVVGILIDLLEHIGRGCGVADVDQLHIKGQGGATGNHIASSTIAVRQTGGNGQLPLLAHAHVGQSLVPSLDHLAGAQLEGERLVPVKAAMKRRIVFLLFLCYRVGGKL